MIISSREGFLWWVGVVCIEEVGKLMHCEVAYGLWNRVFGAFGVQWVIPSSVAVWVVELVGEAFRHYELSTLCLGGELLYLVHYMCKLFQPFVPSKRIIVSNNYKLSSSLCIFGACLPCANLSCLLCQVLFCVSKLYLCPC